VPLDQLRNIGRLLQENINLATRSTMNGDVQAARRDMDAMDGNIATITRIWDAYMATYLTPEEARLAEEFARTRGQFVQQGLRPAQECCAPALRGEPRPHQYQHGTRCSPVGENIEALLKLQIDVAGQEYAKATELYQSMRLYAILAIVLAWPLFWGWPGCWCAPSWGPWSRPSRWPIASPTGELDNRIEIERNDELGKLLRCPAQHDREAVRRSWVMCARHPMPSVPRRVRSPAATTI
jgi:hypothetical protein